MFSYNNRNVIFGQVAHDVSHRSLVFLACFATPTALCCLSKCQCNCACFCITLSMDLPTLHSTYCILRCPSLTTYPCLSFQDDDVDTREYLQGGNVCAVCHRISTPNYKVQRVGAPAGARRRKYGDFTTAGDPLRWVCPECHEYMSPNTNVAHTSTWSCAWPAVLWSVFSGRLRTDPVRTVQMLPLSLRAMWSVAFHDMPANVQRVWHLPPVFADTTRTLSDFKAVFADCRIVPLMRWLDDHSFPTVKCPMGCSIFIDDLQWGRARFMPVTHYLRTLIPQFTSFGADAAELAGARPDWPCIHDSLCWLPHLLLTLRPACRL